MTKSEKYKLVSGALSMETDIVMITEIEVVAIHDAMIAEHGGTPGVRDRGLLQSAVQRQLQSLCGGCSVPGIAASLAFGLAKNHAFLDGNKRTSFGAMIAFLDANNVAFDYDPVEAHQVFIRLAAGDVSEQDLSQWIEGLIDHVAAPSFGEAG